MECLAYHKTEKNTKGALLTITEAHKKTKQLIFPISALSEVLRDIDTRKDTFISMAEFFGYRRRTCNFAQTRVAFLDFDINRLAQEGKDIYGISKLHPEAQSDFLLKHCEIVKIPFPSLIIHSGRGLHAKWIFKNYIPSQALPRWQALEKALIARFGDFLGVDKQVCDITRVLRLVGTINTKSQTYCRVVFGDVNSPNYYDFDKLCDTVLPFTRKEIQENRTIITAEKEARKALYLPEKQIITQGNLRLHSIKELWWLRYLDMMKLAKMRQTKGNLEGSRQTILFWALNSLAQSATVARPLQFWNECNTVAQRLGNYRYNDMNELYRRVQAHQRGEKIEYMGKPVISLYRAKTQTLIDLLGITQDEMQSLKVLIDNDLKVNRRRNNRKEAYKRKNKKAGPKRIINGL